MLDRALGHVPDPRPGFVPPASFAATLQLPAPVGEAGALLFASRRLLAELCGFLAAVGKGAQRLRFRLAHEGRDDTCFELNLAAATRDVEHLVTVLRERLERLTLPAPAAAIRLEGVLLLPLAARNLALLPDAREQAETIVRLIERLRARLGENAVHGLETVADHRPEYAWRTTEPGTADPGYLAAPVAPALGAARPASARCDRRRAAARRTSGARRRPRVASSRDGGTTTISLASITSRAIPPSPCSGFTASAAPAAAGFCTAILHSPMLPAYAELHCLSNFTFLRGASHPWELIERACELGYKGLAITDECSVAGVVRAHEAVKKSEAAQSSAFKLIIGSEIRLEDGLKLVLLAASRRGYGNLCTLITLGRGRAKKGGYRLTREDLASGLPDCPGSARAGRAIAARAGAFRGRMLSRESVDCHGTSGRPQRSGPAAGTRRAG
jgi:hypothetical protein